VLMPDLVMVMPTELQRLSRRLRRSVAAEKPVKVNAVFLPQPVVPPLVDGVRPPARVTDGVGLASMTRVEPMVLVADESRSLIRRRLP